MSERSFAVWSVGLALVFAIVVPEPGREALPLQDGIAQQPPSGPVPLMLPQPSPAPARAQAMTPPSVPYALERAAAVQPAPQRPLMWAVHATP